MVASIIAGLALSYLQLRRNAHLGPDRIRDVQDVWLRRLVELVRRRSTFYAERLAAFDGTIESIPRLDKATLMANLSAANTRSFAGEEILEHCVTVERTRDYSRRFHGCTAAFSSGTSGNRGVELLARSEEKILAALYLARFPFPRGPLRVAFVLRVSSPGLSRSFLGNRMIYIDPMQPIEKILAQIEAERPTVLAAQPSVLRVLAREYAAGRLRWAPRVIAGYAEVFSSADKQKIAETFGCRVFEIYKCTEGSIAQSCHEGRLHINEDLVIVELEPAPASPATEPPRAVVTNLTRRVLPVIRFQLNDCLELDPEPCPCGCAFRVIRQIHGRANDLLWFQRRGRGDLGLVLADYFERAVITSSDDIDEYEVIQTGVDSVRIRIQDSRDADRDSIVGGVTGHLEQIFRQCDCLTPRLDFEFGPVERDLMTGKLIRVRKEWNDD